MTTQASDLKSIRQANVAEPPKPEQTHKKESPTYFGIDPVNHLGVLADFEHMPRNGLHKPSSLPQVHADLVATTTALEFVMVILHELEDKQVRSDYLRNLLEPHIAQLCRTVDATSVLIDRLRQD